MVTTLPPSIGIFFSFPDVKNPTQRPSGEKNPRSRPLCPPAAPAAADRACARTDDCVRRSSRRKDCLPVRSDDRCGTSGEIALARPESRTFTVPSARTLMLAGFRARWMTPCSCARFASRASA
jgi:hypothetical protein